MGLLVDVRLFALVAVAVALAGEIAARCQERHRTGQAETVPLLFYRHGRLGHALVRDFGHASRVHRDGFRGPELTVQKAPGVMARRLAEALLVSEFWTFAPLILGRLGMASPAA